MTPISGRRVLVTGGAGFVGSHLVDALAPDNEVTVLDDSSTGEPARLPDDVELIEADVADPGALSRATPEGGVVFHLAARTSVERSVERPVATHETNCEGSLRVLEAARRADARVVVASSAAVYGDPEALPVDESAPKRPRSPYGVQKLSTDHLARAYHDLHGLETVVLRYFNVYGSRQRADGYAGVIAAFVRQARAGDPLTVHGDGEQTRDFVHVSDVVAANLAAARDLPRALRLRGLGGQITMDLAPMPKKERRVFEDTLRAAFRADAIETTLAGWTPLGHYELQRQRQRQPLWEILS